MKKIKNKECWSLMNHQVSALGAGGHADSKSKARTAPSVADSSNKGGKQNYKKPKQLDVSTVLRPQDSNNFRADAAWQLA